MGESLTILRGRVIIKVATSLVKLATIMFEVAHESSVEVFLVFGHVGHNHVYKNGEIRGTVKLFGEKNKFFFVVKLARGGQPLACQKSPAEAVTKPRRGRLTIMKLFHDY